MILKSKKIPKFVLFTTKDGKKIVVIANKIICSGTKK